MLVTAYLPTASATATWTFRIEEFGARSTLHVNGLSMSGLRDHGPHKAYCPWGAFKLSALSLLDSFCCAARHSLVSARTLAAISTLAAMSPAPMSLDFMVSRGPWVFSDRCLTVRVHLACFALRGRNDSSPLLPVHLSFAIK